MAESIVGKMTDSEPLIEQTTVKKTSFAGDVLKLVSGTTIAQVIGLLASPVIARLYSPEAFGIVALLTSIISVVTAVFTLEYDVAINLPRQNSDAANILAGSLGVTIFFTVITVLVIWLGGPLIVDWLNAPELVVYLWMVPLIALFGGVGIGHPALIAWASRTRQFTRVSIIRVTVGLVTSISKIIAGLAGFNTAGSLMGANLFGAVTGPILLGWQIWRHDSHLFIESIRLPRIWENLKRYRKFAIYNAPAALLNTISWQVPSFLLSFFFSPVIVGFYSFGNQLLRMPMNLIGGSFAQAFYVHAATAKQNGTLAEFVESTFRRLVEYSFFPILMLAVIGRELCVVVFGAKWTEAGVYIQILSLWTLFWFISSPMSRLYSVLEKNEQSFALNIVIFITRVLSIWMGGLLNSPRIALILFSISGAVVYGYLCVSIIFYSGVSWRRIGRILLKNIAIFVPAGGGIVLLKLMMVADWIQVIIATLFVGVYYIYRFKKDGYLEKILSKIIVGRKVDR